MAKAILIAEDDENDAVLLKLALQKAGVENPVFTMNDGDQVIAYLKGDTPYANREKFPLPSVLLLDLKMPRLSGFQVMEWLHAQKDFKSLLVVVLTGHDGLREVQQAYKLGAHSFLIKPCKSEDIKNLIHWYSEHWNPRT